MSSSMVTQLITTLIGTLMGFLADVLKEIIVEEMLRRRKKMGDVGYVETDVESESIKTKKRVFFTTSKLLVGVAGAGLGWIFGYVIGSSASVSPGLSATPANVVSTPMAEFSPTPSSLPTLTLTLSPTPMVSPASLSRDEGKWSGILSVRMPTLNEIRAEKPISIWDANLIDVEDMPRPGVLTYYGKVRVYSEYLLPTYWCALSPDLLEQNLEAMTTEFFVNNEKIPEKFIFVYNYDTNTNWYCNYHAVVLGGWASGARYVLEVKRTITATVSDGNIEYPPGEYIYRLIVTAH